MSMRKQFVNTVEKLLDRDDRVVLLLGDIGVFGFIRAFEKFSNRVFNIGILEQTTVSLASGLAKSELIPITHTIAPFLVERSYEQIKIDFGYQRLGGNFVSVGASYDYASLGCTHHCPGDVGILLNIPGIEIIVPGTSIEFDKLFLQSYDNGRATYYRLSERENTDSHSVIFGKAKVIKKGTLATVVAFGPVLDLVLQAVENIDVNVLYYTTIAPFDNQTLIDNLAVSGKILLIEPFYSGTLTHLVCHAVYPQSVAVKSVGVPREFLTHYGHATDHDNAIGLSVKGILTKIEEMING
jgi:transketolase